MTASPPSSSAVTLPSRPGKSILKRAPPPQQSFFSLSRLSKLLPSPSPASSTAPPSNSDVDHKTLKRAHFILPQLSTVYLISAANPPYSPSIREEKRTAEEREAERRRRIVRGNSLGADGSEDWWGMDKVDAFYRECCEGREDDPNPAISAAMMHATGTSPRALDLSGVQITSTSASTLSDVFTIEWGLRKLVLRECNLDDQTLKPILHALLIPGTLSFLSVSSNRRMKTAAYQLLGVYLGKAKTLQFLDLAQNSLDKKSVEYVVASLGTAGTASASGLVSLRLDDCSLRPVALEALAHAVRTSPLRNISLRHNRISANGAVALALMIKDYPDTVPSSTTPSSASSSTPPSPSLPTSHLSPQSPPPTPTSPTSVPPPLKARQTGPIPPPPRHPSTLPQQTTYTPYIPRSRRGPAAAAAAAASAATPNPLSPSGQQVPIITSSAQGGVTTRHPVPPSPQTTSTPTTTSGSPRAHEQGPSAALLDKVRALDALPRLGALRTLDLRGNDIRGGITYIAQVLKRNRTLKVLNLSENKIDVQGLVAIAEALKYNTNLETLDLSKNPCSGPGLEGIQSLRTAFTLNTSLKRLFLSSTSLTSLGAIALAEFLPESTSLLHLDLTMNPLDIAGVMALSMGVKANHTMRCLDLNIPPGNEEMARLCRDILNSCVRNTEEAEKSSQVSPGGESGRGLGRGVWGMIEESELARTFKQDTENKAGSDVLKEAKDCQLQLEALLTRSPSSSSSPRTPTSDLDPELTRKTRKVLRVLSDQIQATMDPTEMETLLGLNDGLTDLLARAAPAVTVWDTERALTGLGLSIPNGDAEAHDKKSEDFVTSPSSKSGFLNGNGIIHEEPDEEEEEPATPKLDKGKGKAEPEPEQLEKILSPTFSITGSDDEDDEERLRFLTVEGTEIPLPSPTDRSRSWVAEEGEVFRKGNVLLGPEEMEGDYAGDELRKELLQAEVERPPPRPLDIDEYAYPGDILATGEPRSPVPASPSSPIVPKQVEAIARPYLARSRSSSNSSLSLATPTSSESKDPTAGQNGTQSPITSRPSLLRRLSSASAVESR